MTDHLTKPSSGSRKMAVFEFPRPACQLICETFTDEFPAAKKWNKVSLHF